MESEELTQNNNAEQKQNGDTVCSPVQEMPISIQTPDTADTDKTNGSPFKIPLITMDNRHIATLVEVQTTDTEQSTTDNDFTPSQEKSYTDIEFTPVEEKPQHDYTEAMDCDDKTIESHHIPSVDFFIEKNVIELARCSWRGSSRSQRYLKGCLWSPDGTCLLTTVNGDGMHVFETPSDLYGSDAISSDRPLDCLQSAVHIKEGGIVYDYCWFPFMNSQDPATCCWLATRQNEPIQLWDAYYGDLRCSYRGYNAVDEVESALSVTFSNDGTEVIGGYKKNLKVFKTDVPGREYTTIPIASPASALACNTVDSVIAVGSWNASITLLDLRLSKYGDICQMNEHRGGITYLRFLSGKNLLVSGGRKDNQLLVWDLRRITEPIVVGQFTRVVNTNQRIYFDISSDQTWLTSGDTSGIIHAWNLNDLSAVQEQTYSVHHDCCNGISMHPTKPILATSSGQHHFEINDILQNEPEIVNGDAKKPRENSLILWWCGKTTLV